MVQWLFLFWISNAQGWFVIVKYGRVHGNNKYDPNIRRGSLDHGYVAIFNDDNVIESIKVE